MRKQNIESREKREEGRGIRPFIACCLVLGALLSAGCSRTVTILPVVGNRLSVEITFRENVDTSLNKYYILVGPSSPAWPYAGTYFFGPGESYDTNKMNISTDLAYYYVNYFSTWSDFIVLSSDNFYQTKGPFTSSSLHSSYIPVLLSARTIASTKKINLTFDLSRLSSIPATLHFNFVTVDKDGYLRDYLHATDNSISTNIGSIVSDRVDISNPGISGGLDIISWSMEVQ